MKNKLKKAKDIFTEMKHTTHKEMVKIHLVTLGVWSTFQRRGWIKGRGYESKHSKKA